MPETIADLERRFYEKRLNPGPGPDPVDPGLGDLLVTDIRDSDTDYTNILTLDKLVPAGDTLIIAASKTLTSSQLGGFASVTGVEGTWTQVANSVRLSTVNVMLLACKLTADAPAGTELTVEYISSANRRVAVCFSLKGMAEEIVITTGAQNGDISDNVNVNGSSNVPNATFPGIVAAPYVVFAHSVAGTASVIEVDAFLTPLAEIKTSGGSGDRGVWVGYGENIAYTMNTLSGSQGWASCMVGFDGVQ